MLIWKKNCHFIIYIASIFRTLIYFTSSIGNCINHLIKYSKTQASKKIPYYIWSGKKCFFYSRLETVELMQLKPGPVFLYYIICFIFGLLKRDPHVVRMEQNNNNYIQTFFKLFSTDKFLRTSTIISLIERR